MVVRDLLLSLVAFVMELGISGCGALAGLEVLAKVKSSQLNKSLPSLSEIR